MFKYRHIIAFLLVVFSLNCMAQNDKKEVSSIEKNIQNLQNEIELANKLLEETQQNKQTTIGQINLIKSKITKRENLIATYQRQLLQIEDELKKSQKEIARLQAELKALRSEYAHMVEFAYKNRDSYSKLAFLFSSNDFNQAFRRMKYIQQYGSFRKERIQKIEIAEKKLSNEITDNQREKEKKTAFLEAERREQVLLDNERVSVDKQIQQLSKKEQEIRNSIRAKEKEAKRLQEAIENIIAEEIKKSQKIAKDKPIPADKLMQLTPEERKLSNSFASNKGKLPWPTETGVISSPFGTRQHPVLNKITINNKGVDIATKRGADARAVFEGVVVSINKITATNNAVIVRHGHYFTVYSNLEVVYVKRGDKIKTKDVIGKIHTDRDEQKTELHFELWDNKTINNPTNWLAR